MNITVRERIKYLADRPEGYTVLLRAIKAMESGEPIPAEDAAVLIPALRYMLENDPSDMYLYLLTDKFKITGKQGRKDSAKSESKGFAAVLEAYLDEYANDKKTTQKEIAEKHGVDVRTVGRWFAKHKETARATARGMAARAIKRRRG